MDDGWREIGVACNVSISIYKELESFLSGQGAGTVTTDNLPKQHKGTDEYLP